MQPDGKDSGTIKKICLFIGLRQLLELTSADGSTFFLRKGGITESRT